MAYISSNQKDDEKDQGLNVFGGQNQMQQQPGQDANAQQNQQVSLTSAPGSIQGGAPAPQSPQPQQQKGSGAFTDLRKYVQANKPQAQQLGQAAAQNIQKQAEQVGGQVAQASQQFQQNVGMQQQQLGQAKDFATQQIQQAAQGKMVDTPKIQQFQQLTSGEKKFGDVGALNLAAQQQAAQKLAGLSGQAERASGATNLLQEAFGGQQYTRGQKALDAMILGGDRAAREALMTGTQQATTGLDQQLRDARAAALAEASGLGQQDTQFRADLASQLESERGKVASDIDARTQQIQQEMKNEQQKLVEMVQNGQLSVEDFNKYIDQTQLQAAAKQFSATKEQLVENLSSPTFKPPTPDEINLMSQRYNSGDIGNAMGIGGNTLMNISRAIDSIDSLKNMGVPEAQIVDSYRQDLMDRFLTGTIKNLNHNSSSPPEGLKIEGLQRTWIPGTMNYTWDITNPEAAALSVKNMSNEQIMNIVKGKMGTPAMGFNHKQILGDIANSVQAPTTASLAERTVADINRAAQQGQDITKYLSQIDPTTITSSQAISDELLARQSALAALAGREGEGVQRQGTLPTQAATFDFAKLLRDISGIRV